ncbi:hypothetical protein LTR85_003633 [Meristemomyces frigidus]|nr:hypothetical protein LTR85_003633 [Meristemomyces frigidus]
MLHLGANSPPLNAPLQVHAKNKNYPMDNTQRIGRGIFPDSTSPDPTQFVNPGPGLGPFGAFSPQNPPVIPPQIAPPAENPPWGGFLARVCSVCERMIRSQQNYRGMHVPHGVPGGAQVQATILATPRELREWEAYPRISCTCRYKLGMPLQRPPGRAGLRMCYKHREAQLRELEKKKDANDAWLRNIARNGKSQLVWADQITDPNPFGACRISRKQKRNATGDWRGCRCGRELDVDFAMAEAFICMACEGWVSTRGPMNSKWDSSAALGWVGLTFHTEEEVSKFRRATVKLQRKVG